MAPAARRLLWAASAAALGVLLSGDWVRPFDHSLDALLRDPSGRPLGPAPLQEASRDLTALGSVFVLGLATALAIGGLLLLRRARDAAWAALLLLGAWPTVFALKALWGRPRPALYEPAAKTFTASFPSAHAMLALVVWAGLAHLALPVGHALRRPALAAATILALCVGLSRVHLGVHHGSDVLAGWLFGAAWLLLLAALRNDRRGPLGPEPQAL